MAKWETHRHVVGGRTFVVLDHMTDSVMVNGVATGTSEVWRTVEDARTGEVVREFKAPQGLYAMPTYDFTEGQQWLEDRYSKKEHQPVAYATWGTGISSGVTYNAAYNAGNHNHIKEPEFDYEAVLGVMKKKPTKERTELSMPPEEAEFIAECRYGGYCYQCDDRIDVGSPIWWFRPPKGRSRIWCGIHKTIPAPAVEDTQEEEDNDMAQRHDFTFPYTGGEIATSLERKAAKMDAQIQPTLKVDIETLKLAGYTTERAQKDFLEEAEGKRAKANKKLADDAAALRKEAIPYAKASKQTFDIDLEDIEFFGLNDDDAPQTAPRKRTRRTREQIEADKAASAA